MVVVEVAHTGMADAPSGTKRAKVVRAESSPVNISATQRDVIESKRDLRKKEWDEAVTARAEAKEAFFNCKDQDLKPLFKEEWQQSNHAVKIAQVAFDAAQTLLNQANAVYFDLKPPAEIG